MKKLLWISDFLNSGYAMISNTLVHELLKTNLYEIYIFVINTSSNRDVVVNNILKNINIPKERIYINDFNKEIYEFNEENALIDKSKNNYITKIVCGANKIEEIVLKIKPNIIFTINDNGILSEQIDGLNNIHKKWKCKVFGYLAIDCSNFRENFFKKLEKYDVIITMTEFGKNELVKTNIKIPIKILNHAINNNIFKKINKNQCRLRLFNETIQNKFLILNSNVNINRKRLDICLKAFSQFCVDKDNVLLILKCLKSKTKNSFDIDYLINKYSIDKNKVICIEKILDLNELGLLYNCVDIGINTTSGEGWGLIPCEMALCGIPQIVPNNTSYPEIFGSNFDYAKTNSINYISGRKKCTREVKLNKNSFIVYLLSFPTKFKKEAKHTYVDNINIKPDCYNILISEFGDNYINETNINIGNNIIIQLNLNSISLLNKAKYLLKDKIFQVIVQFGEKSNFLKKNMVKKIFDDLDRDTYQLFEEVIYGKFDNYNITVNVPEVNDIIRLLNKYYYDRKLLENDGEKCRNRILSKFRPEKICKDLIDILEE
jgi:glycosyltransferase involved in cell wall biosynthesis